MLQANITKTTQKGGKMTVKIMYLVAIIVINILAVIAGYWFNTQKYRDIGLVKGGQHE